MTAEAVSAPTGVRPKHVRVSTWVVVGVFVVALGTYILVRPPYVVVYVGPRGEVVTTPSTIIPSVTTTTTVPAPTHVATSSTSTSTTLVPDSTTSTSQGNSTSTTLGGAPTTTTTTFGTAPSTTTVP